MGLLAPNPRKELRPLTRFVMGSVIANDGVVMVSNFSSGGSEMDMGLSAPNPDKELRPLTRFAMGSVIANDGVVTV